jgi:hypothetical protein
MDAPDFDYRPARPFELVCPHCRHAVQTLASIGWSATFAHRLRNAQIGEERTLVFAALNAAALILLLVGSIRTTCTTSSRTA